MDGETIVADAAVEQRVAAVDVRLADAEVHIGYDAADSVLMLKVASEPRAGGAQWLISSASNYPTFLARGEIRLMDMGAIGGPRLIAVAPLLPNAQTVLPAPNGEIPAVIYCVYGDRGRFDETAALLLATLAATTDGAPEVTNIHVRGGAVTVSADNLGENVRLLAFGETIRPNGRGEIQLERILPNGMHEIDVAIVGGNSDLSFGRDNDIDVSGWFYVVVADATFWTRKDGETGAGHTENLARLQFYVAGETEGGVEVSASLDTGEGDIRYMFRHLDQKDPRAVAGRLLSQNAHVTYGDDSSSVDLTSTSGRVFLRVARDENYGVWGDYQAQIAGSGYLRSARKLYGAQVHL